MKQYLEFLRSIRDKGVIRDDRTGTGTSSIFGYQMRFDLAEGFPLVTTKKVHFKSVVYELLWFLSGQTNIRYLTDNGVRIWNAWALENGELGPVYGQQWRRWQTPQGRTIDQLAEVVDKIRHQPHSRRLLVLAWNPADLPDENQSPHDNVRNGRAALPPCHVMFQFYVARGRLSCMLTQRSADAFLGVPFNIASYALLTHMVADQCRLKPGELIWSGGDCHIYHNHREQIDTQLARLPCPLPTLKLLRTPEDLFQYHYDDIALSDYQHHPAIKGAVSV